MTNRKYLTDPNRIRENGVEAFSAKGRAIADKRRSASDGRIDRILGQDDTFSAGFKESIREDYLWILERVHLREELEAAKKIIYALSKAPTNKEAARLLRRMREDPRTRRGDCLLCPVWRHERQYRVAAMSTARYVFPLVRDELFLVTVIFDFAENLFELEEAIKAAHRVLQETNKQMTSRRRGVFMVGAFEPDLVGPDELRVRPYLVRMMRDQKREIPSSGGWVLTGHFFVRVPHRNELEYVLNDLLPASNWDRVRFDRVLGNETLEHDLLAILGYAAKYPKPLFSPPTKGKKRRAADKYIGSLWTAFGGPDFDGEKLSPGQFDLNAAIRQWALFVTRVGPNMIYYSVESTHAQKWYSRSEMDYIRYTNWDEDWKGRSRIEMHRDTGPFSGSKVQPRLKGKCRRLQSRRLRFDSEWERDTDCTGIDLDTQVPMFDWWIRKKK